MTVRGSLARNLSSGPEFRVIPNRIVIKPTDGIKALQDYTEDNQVAQDLQDKLKQLGFKVKRLDNINILIAETDRLENVVSNIIHQANTFQEQSVKRLKNVLNAAQNGVDSNLLESLRLRKMNFTQEDDLDVEANLRKKLEGLTTSNPVTEALEDIKGVDRADLAFTRTTFGPRYLGADPDVLPDISSEELDDFNPSKTPHVGDALDKIGVDEVWQETKGQGAIVADFDTSFCANYLKSDRVIDTFSGSDVPGAYAAPEEGHGTMTAYSASGSSDVSGLPFDGAAPGSEQLLARVTNKQGSLVFIEEAWNWLLGHIRNAERPIISNHSYGIPLCSAPQMDLCSSTTAQVVKQMNARDDHQSFHAAGNEALYCGHRLSGLTNGVTGVNSLPSTMTVGAFRYDLVDAQTYSSHGFGDCSNVAKDPKPDVGSLIPDIVPYGCKLKNMSTDTGGSTGGTSEATPLTAGIAALISSKLGHAKTEVLEDIFQSTATLPRRTQMNILTGFDARFGYGQVRANDAFKEVRGE